MHTININFCGNNIANTALKSFNISGLGLSLNSDYIWSVKNEST